MKSKQLNEAVIKKLGDGMKKATEKYGIVTKKKNGKKK